VHGFWETEPADNVSEGLEQSADNTARVVEDLALSSFGLPTQPESDGDSSILGALVAVVGLGVGLWLLRPLLEIIAGVVDE
jgi:hypothetical protein